jgi:hypothetical protein
VTTSEGVCHLYCASLYKQCKMVQVLSPPWLEGLSSWFPVTLLKGCTSGYETLLSVGHSSQRQHVWKHPKSKSEEHTSCQKAETFGVLLFHFLALRLCRLAHGKESDNSAIKIVSWLEALGPFNLRTSGPTTSGTWFGLQVRPLAQKASYGSNWCSTVAICGEWTSSFELWVQCDLMPLMPIIFCSPGYNGSLRAWRPKSITTSHVSLILRLGFITVTPSLVCYVMWSFRDLMVLKIVWYKKRDQHGSYRQW